MSGEDVFQQYKDEVPKRSFAYSRWGERFRWLLRSPYRSPVVGIASMFIAVAIIENIVVRLVYGNDHPQNRFTWRRMEKRGEISPEMLEKRRTLNAYHMQAMHQINMEPFNVKSKRNPELAGFGKVSFD